MLHRLQSFQAKNTQKRSNIFNRTYFQRKFEHPTYRSFCTKTFPPPTSPIFRAVDHASDLLPHQGVLENFIHHNPLGHLESMNFKDALEHVQKLESYLSPGERVFSLVHVDPRKRVNEALADLSSAFADCGGAKWAPRYRDKGFLYFFASLECVGFSPWRKHARETAKRILDHYQKYPDQPNAIVETIICENLEFFGVPSDEWEDSIRVTLLELRGWAGMFRRMETHPNEAPGNANVRLVDFCAVQSILTRASIETLARHSGWDQKAPLSLWLAKEPKYRVHKPEVTAHASAIAFVDQSSDRRESLETEFKYTLLNAIGTKPQKRPETRPSLQLYTCIDDRECSIRRHVEEVNPKEIETFGVAGFFGIPIRYESVDGRGQQILAPEGQYPTAVLTEGESKSDHQHNTTKYQIRRRLFARIALLGENLSFSPIGSLFLATLFPFSLLRIFLMGFLPDLKNKMEERFKTALIPKPHTDFQIPFPPEQAAALLARTFKDIGTHNNFAPVVIVLGHGAISVNNPFFAAYNCGACGGREGGPNARLLARLANDPSVRASLQKDHDINVPDDTWFIGGIHNTTTDTVEFYDLESLPSSHVDQFQKAQQIIERARGENALERCHRFLLAKNIRTPEEALQHVRIRSTDLAEVRPELNHATNAAVVVGRRELTKNHFLDRRVFLPSYDPYSDDEAGTNLEHVLAPALNVCSGINLEYLFSTIDMEHHGAGTKVPLNVVGNIGVLQGTSGDLRPGLPSQMTEMHTPIRALYVIDAPIQRVEAVLARREELRQLVRNEWVRFLVRDPESGVFYRQSQGEYFPIDPKESTEFVPFTRHRNHGLHVAKTETIFYWAASAGMVLSCGIPLYLFAETAMNPHGTLIALCGTLLSLPVLAFSRRYLHGEFMFGRFSALSVGLLLGFNLVALAPNLEHAMAGWGLFGFASTFLIGAYNDRPTVRNNATFAFAAYRISDLAMLVATTFTEHHITGYETSPIATGALLLAAFFKSSQFPLTVLFIRSMEGPTPASALGYAGLSAHVGVVLLTSTMPIWFCYDWARITLASVGIYTALYGSIVSKIRADRKGSLARATSATIGLIFVILAMGHPDIALLLSLGHAAFRIIQILRSPNIIAETQNLRSSLGRMPWPKYVPDWLYKLCWRFRRIDTDFHLLNVLHWMSRRLHAPKPPVLNKFTQWLVTGTCVVLAGAPFTPLSHYMENLLMDLLQTQPALAGLIMVVHFGISVMLIRYLLVSVLHRRRFHTKAQSHSHAHAHSKKEISISPQPHAHSHTDTKKKE